MTTPETNEPPESRRLLDRLVRQLFFQEVEEMTIIERLTQSICDDEKTYVNLHFARPDFDELLKAVERAEGVERGLLLLCEALMGRQQEPPPEHAPNSRSG